MSYVHINRVRDHSKTRGPARLVLLTIATRTDEEGYAWPSYACLAKDTGMTIRSVRRALTEIPTDELVMVERAKSHRSATYRVTITDTVTDSHGKSKTTALSAHNEHETVNQKLQNSSLSAPNAHEVSQTSPLCAPNAHKDVTLQLRNDLCARTGTSLCANEHPLRAHMDTLCAPIAHRTVIEQPEEEQSENSHASDSSFLLENQKTEKSCFAALTPEKENPNPLPKIETKEELVARLTKEFAATVDVQDAAAKYEQHLADTGQTWKNGRFVSLVTELHRRKIGDAPQAPGFGAEP